MRRRLLFTTLGKPTKLTDGTVGVRSRSNPSTLPFCKTSSCDATAGVPLSLSCELTSSRNDRSSASSNASSIFRDDADEPLLRRRFLGGCISPNDANEKSRSFSFQPVTVPLVVLVVLVAGAAFWELWRARVAISAVAFGGVAAVSAASVETSLRFRLFSR